MTTPIDEWIERVLDAAAARGLRSREDPVARLPKRQKLTRGHGHRAAMPFGDVPEFITRLREWTGLALGRLNSPF